MQADRWAHHHTAMVLTGIFLCAFVASRQFLMPHADTHAATLDCTTASNIVVSTGECQTLMDLYISTNGQNWVTGTNWGTDTDICSRYGITCGWPIETLHVQDIDLTSNNLSGSLPSSINGLTWLHNLLLGYNNLHGEIPSTLWQLGELSSVLLLSNSFSGVVSNDFSAAHNLSRLDLALNSGLVMDFDSLDTLDHSLQMLDIHNLHTTGDISKVWQLTWLEELTLENINYAGDLSVIWDAVTNLHSLGILKLKQLEFWWSLPDIWDNFPLLHHLSLQFDNFIGHLPPSIQNLGALTNLEISFNHFDGSIPQSFTGLTDGDISTNCFDTTSVSGTLYTSLQTHVPGWDNQYNCRSNIALTGSISGSGLMAGSCSTYTISYNNLGPQTAKNVIIRQLFDSHVTVSGSVPAYATGYVGRDYGTLDDPCYAQAALSATGPYFSPFEQILITNYGTDSLYHLAVNGLGFTGLQGTTEFKYLMDVWCPFVFGIHDDPRACLLQFGLDISSLDPSCGTWGELGYIWDVGNVADEWSDTIDVNLCVPSDFTGSVSFSSIISTLSTNENNDGWSQSFSFVVGAHNQQGTGDTQTGDNQSEDNNDEEITPPSNEHRRSGAPRMAPRPTKKQHEAAAETETEKETNTTTPVETIVERVQALLPSQEVVRQYISSVQATLSVGANTETVQAFLFAHEAKLTSATDYNTARPEDGITRAEFAKLLVAFIENVLGRTPDASRMRTCAHYNDVDSSLWDLEMYITKSCMHKVMGVENNGLTPLEAFDPHTVLTRKDVVTTLSRVIWGNKYDNADPYYTKHMDAMHAVGLIKGIDPDMTELRINAFVMFKRLVEKAATLF